ncbi:MAG TPA: type II secretion system protein GspM [Spirochaetota bacterium]|nr:type II secretion system protein GspM [Spirochaetota bacterium]HPF04426.1 type II secretion system protein GspM [Spirochaetota bacterium]HPJ40802.1 type II secretion system protein GspM [Spirochaetota bacterium]HPR36071.1 type II secretion system protein GspM [Spirochaetota bacterium]HRX45985.1 type II secretion system protein GspM [Spirochaetota bacterium]
MINLSRREKRLLMLLALIIITGVLYFFIIKPVSDFKKQADNSYERNMARLNKLEELNNDYRDILAEKSRLNAAAPDGKGIAPLVDEIAGSLNISGNKTYLRENPGVIQNGIQKITTEIKFEGIPISSLLEFINRLENSNSTLKIKNILINSGIKERSRYDAILTVVSLTKR